jgi:hypothetical protein
MRKNYLNQDKHFALISMPLLAQQKQNCAIYPLHKCCSHATYVRTKNETPALERFLSNKWLKNPANAGVFREFS